MLHRGAGSAIGGSWAPPLILWGREEILGEAEGQKNALGGKKMLLPHIWDEKGEDD